jgi:uncharacterized protein
LDAEINLITKRQYNTIILTGIGIAILFYPVVEDLIYLKSVSPLVRWFFSRLLMWTTLPLLYQYGLKVENRSFLIWKEKAGSIYFYIAVIAVLMSLTMFANGISYIPSRLGFHDNYKILRYYDNLLRQNKGMALFTCITAGTTEELVIRGYVYPRLCLFFKSVNIPVVISSLIFSLMHLGYGCLSECIFTFLFGVMCAVCYQKYRNIKVLIIFHFLYDLLVSF